MKFSFFKGRPTKTIFCGLLTQQSISPKFNFSTQKNFTKMSSFDSATEWKPPAKIEELFAATAGNKFAAINSPVAGAREERELPVGTAPVQLYSLFTPNGKLICLSYKYAYICFVNPYRVIATSI